MKLFPYLLTIFKFYKENVVKYIIKHAIKSKIGLFSSELEMILTFVLLQQIT